MMVKKYITFEIEVRTDGEQHETAIKDVTDKVVIFSAERGGAMNEQPKDWDGDYDPTWSQDYICDSLRQKPDPVNHPSHYETGKFESIDVMVETQGVEAVKSFCICNAFKYIYRHKFKNGVEDIRKAIWYLNKYVELDDNK